MKKSKETDNSLLKLKKEELKDITLLDINYRTVISFSLLGEDIPILIKLEDIKHRDIQEDLKVRGDLIPQIEDNLFNKGISLLVENIFEYVEWDVIDLFDDEEYHERKIEIENKYTTKYSKNYFKIDKELEELKKEIIYNLKAYIKDRAMIDIEIQNELMRIYNEIRTIRLRIVNEFVDVLDNIMNYDDDKNINFTDFFTVMAKAGIVNSSQPIFKENIGRAFADYSFREIKLRLSFEHKETMLNVNKMKMMIPLKSMSLF